MNLKLIGPFPSDVPPVREGVYKVKTPSAGKGNKYAYWSRKHGWHLCGKSVKEAWGEKQMGTEWCTNSSMYTPHAVWWGIPKDYP